MDFSSVTISFFVHSTEDEDRILKLVEDIFGIENTEIIREKISGHFGNQITVIRAHIIGQRAQIVAHRIVVALSSEARASIHGEITRSLDEHDSLYLRLDRQSFEDRTLSVSDEEPIRVKLKPKVRSGRQFMIRQYEEMIE